MIIIELAYSFHLGSDKNKRNTSRSSAKSNRSGSTSLSNNAIQNSAGLTKVDKHNYRKYDNNQNDIEIIKGSSSLVDDVKKLYKEEFDEAKEEVKAKSEKMKALQARNTPTHRLGGPGYEGKRHIGAKEDAERESLGIPDPLAEFTDPLEHDWIRARYKWDKVRKIFYTDTNTREFKRLLVIVVLPHYHISLQSI